MPYFGQSGSDWHKPSRLAPASRFGDAGPDPFLTPKDTPLKSFEDVRKRIDAYDQKTIGDQFVETTLPWTARTFAGEVGHDHYPFPENNKYYNAAPKKLKDLASNRLTYKEIFDIDDQKIYKLDGLSWKEYLTDKSTQQQLKETIRNNFNDFKLKNFKFKPVGPLAYLKRTVIGNNVGSFIVDLEEGRMFPFLARLVGLTYFGWNIVSNTKKAYQEARSQENGSLGSKLKTLLKTGVSFCTESVKATAAWEIGSIGFLIGSSLLCIGTIPSTIAGCLFGGLLEAGFKSLTSSKKPKHHHHQDAFYYPVLPNQSASQLHSKSVLHQGMEVLA